MVISIEVFVLVIIWIIGVIIAVGGEATNEKRVNLNVNKVELVGSTMAKLSLIILMILGVGSYMGW